MMSKKTKILAGIVIAVVVGILFVPFTYYELTSEPVPIEDKMFLTWMNKSSKLMHDREESVWQPIVDIMSDIWSSEPSDYSGSADSVHHSDITSLHMAGINLKSEADKFLAEIDGYPVTPALEGVKRTYKGILEDYKTAGEWFAEEPIISMSYETYIVAGTALFASASDDYKTIDKLMDVYRNTYRDHPKTFHQVIEDAKQFYKVEW